MTAVAPPPHPRGGEWIHRETRSRVLFDPRPGPWHLWETSKPTGRNGTAVEWTREAAAVVPAKPETAGMTEAQFVEFCWRATTEHPERFDVLMAIAEFPDRLWRWAKRAELMRLVGGL